MAAKAADGYKESDDHVPNPTDMTGVVDTTGTGGPQDANDVTAIFAEARKADLETAQRALDPKDDDVPSSLVVMPDDADAKAVASRLADAAKAAEKPAPAPARASASA